MTNNPPGSGSTLQNVLDGLADNSSLSATRRRDLRSAVICFAALMDSSPAYVSLDLAAIRSVLDLMVPIQAKVSRKRWANLRSDLAAAIGASGFQPMFKTSSVELNESWASLLSKAPDRRMRDGLSRFARWASERQISPRDVNREVVDRFVADLETASLVRKIAELGQTIVRSWNRLVQAFPDEGLQPIEVTRRMSGPPRFPWQDLPASFRQDVDKYLEWASVPAIAKEWVRVPADALAALKATRQKLGALPIGLTDKNKNVLRQFNDKGLLGRLVNLPDKLWRDTSVKLKTSRREFIDLQSALAIDILLVAPVRMKNLAELKFDEHIQWPQGQGKSAVILFKSDETKNRIPLEFEFAAPCSCSAPARTTSACGW